jgi:MinD superfamily P-loop ATPase
VIEPAECHGCGCCVAECPGKAITLKHFTDQQIIAKTAALFEKKKGEALIYGRVCNRQPENSGQDIGRRLKGRPKTDAMRNMQLFLRA